MASGAGVLIFVPTVSFMHNFYAQFLCNIMEIPHVQLPRPSLTTIFELSSFNLFLLHIFLPTSLAEDNELTLARYYIPSPYPST